MRIVEDPEEEAAFSEFARGVSLPLVALHFERGELDEAATVARLALSRENCPDAAQIEEILERCSEPPADWKNVLDRFAENPTVERWHELMQFVPDDLLYQRLRNGVRYLRKRGVDPNVLFGCACVMGMTPDAIELVDDGLVSVETIMARADEAGPARGAYVGLAAQSAYLNGDFLGAVRLLRESLANETEWITALPHIWFIRERASDEENAALDRAGIPGL
jgi:hypothetical protein